MKKFLLVMAMLCACPFCVRGTGIDWPAFMSGQDMVWKRLPERWHEAPFLGNGSMGAYVCKQPGENALRIDVGNGMVHDHRLDLLNIYGRCRLLIGYFLLQPVGDIVSGNMRLDLWNAETDVELLTAKGSIRLRICVVSEAPYILVEADATEGEAGFTWKFCPEPTDSPRQLRAVKNQTKHVMPGYVSNPPSQISEEDGVGLCWQPLLAGGGTATAWKELKKDGRRMLAVSNAHTFPDTTAVERAANAVSSLSADDLSALWNEHRRWWHEYYPQSFVSLPDKKLENFYWIQMYKMASATRLGGGLIDNCGPWLILTDWPNAWWNLNVQLAYWAAYPSNRLDLGLPLAEALRLNQDNLARNVPEPYRKDASALPVATGFDLRGAGVHAPGTGKAQVGCLPWACHNVWLHYRYSMDESILRHTLYPVLRRAVNFYLAFLEEDSDGTLHLKPTFSPEYGIAEDCNFDLALLRWGCRTLIESARILGISDELLSRWQEVLEKLTDYPQNEQEGVMIGRDVPYAFSHRHYSHLLMFYPLYLLNADQPGSKELMEKSVGHWLSLDDKMKGYSFTGASSLYAAFGEGDKALEWLYRLIDTQLLPNTMYTEHGGPTLETPLTGAQCIHDMLLQSWGGKIRVFPAVPSQWGDVVFRHLRTEGAFLVSALRKGGKTCCIQVKSLAGEPCVIRTDMENPALKSGRAILEKVAENEYALDLQKGETVVLVPEGGKIPAFAPVGGEGTCFFGLE